MTRKHFAAFAEKISQMENRADAAMIAAFCVELFESENPRFNRNRFLEACKCPSYATSAATR